MCGIAGSVRLGDPPGNDAPPSDRLREVLREMAHDMRHRGPDAQTLWASSDGRCVLSHARLHVIDLEGGGQPMATEDGHLQLVYNGEIYNFRELRGELEARGHRFRTASDTEVLLHGYAEWGWEVVSHLEGMFAFGLWDTHRDRLLLARDRTGQKPLHVARVAGHVVFASELAPLRRAVAALGGRNPEIRPGAVAAYLGLGYVPAPMTAFDGIEKVMPATALLVHASGAEEVHTWWSPDWNPSPSPPEDPRAEVRRLLTEAVEKRLVADVPIGAFLSGGLDSTLIVGLMSRLVDQPVRTFSVGFPGQASYDEEAVARRVSAHFGTRHTPFPIDEDDVDFEVVDRLVALTGEPFADSSILPTWLLAGRARRDVTVALTGDGGDELFAGYDRFRAARLADGLPRWIVSLGRTLSHALPSGGGLRSPLRRATRFFDAAALSPEARLVAWLDLFGPDALAHLHDHRRTGVDDGVILAPHREAVRGHEGASVLARALAMNFATYLPDDLLVKADRASMAHGLELRSPFLDRSLLAFAMGLPDGQRVRGGRGKWILREAFSDLVPDFVLRRPKQGFGVPLPHWLRGRWRDASRDRLFASDRRLDGWVRGDTVERLWNEHQEMRADHTHRLWALVVLESWLRTVS